MKEVYHILSVVLLVTLLLSVTAGAEVIGMEGFDYTNGSISGLTGGAGWDWDNTIRVHTSTVSDWDSGASALIESGTLVTVANNAALREYNGPTEGSGSDENPTDERLGAFRGTGTVYHAVTMTKLVQQNWCGYSSYDPGGAERIFFGQYWQEDATKYFGIKIAGGERYHGNIAVANTNQAYRLVSAIDFDGDQVRLWVDPDDADYDNGVSDNTADIALEYTGDNWSSAVRLASENDVRWDDLVVFDDFDDHSIRDAALNPYPASRDGGKYDTDVTLSWDTGDNPATTLHKLYMSTAADPNPVWVADITSTGGRDEYGPLSLARDATYYWRVDEVAGSTIKGYVWSFDTVLSTPIIDPETPADILVAPGASAVFEVTASNPFAGHETAVSYQWCKEPNTVLSDGGDYGGTDTDTLTVLDCQAGDEGGYFCQVTNTEVNTASSDSRTANLAVKRLIAYWPFESETDPSSVVAGSPSVITVGNPQFVSGIVGNAFEFDGSDAFYTDPVQADYFAVCDTNMTICCFVKSTDQSEGGLWTPYVSKHGESNSGWQLRKNGYAYDVGKHCASFTTRGTDNEEGSYSDTEIYDGEWHFVAGTFDSAQKKLYIDGELEKTDEVTGSINPSISPVAIAARVIWDGEDWEPQGFATVTLDEVRIYNYSLNNYEIADLYIDVVGGNVCAGGYPESDLNGDCRVDLDDFAAMASQWLEDNNYSGGL